MLTGLLGMFSFGQTAFMAIGAYVSAIICVNYKLPFILGIMGGIAVSCSIAYVVGHITLRLSKEYFSLATFVFGEAVKGLLNTSISITGGALGFTNIPPYTKGRMVYLSCIFIIWLLYNLKHSQLGTMAITIREDEIAAQMQIVSINGHLGHDRRSVRDVIPGHRKSQ